MKQLEQHLQAQQLVIRRHRAYTTQPLRPDSFQAHLAEELVMRILVLHGYSGNGSWQQKKDRRLQKLLSAYGVRLHYAHGPLQLAPFSAEGLQRRLSWWSINRDDSWPRMLTYLLEVFRSDGPFDGVMGYSQGAAVAGGLVAEMLVGHFPASFRFAIVVCGYLAPAPDLKQLLQLLDRQNALQSQTSVLRWRGSKRVDIPLKNLFHFPTLHIMGEVDRVTPLRMNLDMASLFADPVSRLPLTVPHC